MLFKICLVLCCALFRHADTASTYDQSQNGELNVQIDLKDLHIIALMKGGKEEYVDYDYAYDYSEMTIKPQHTVTQKPTNTSNSNSTASSEVQSETNATNGSTPETTTNAHPESLNVSSTVVTVVPDMQTSTTEIVTTPANFGIDKNETVLAPNSTDCKKGFILNQKGDCELKLQSAGNALLKLVKLSQKLKLRRENRLKEDQPQ